LAARNDRIASATYFVTLVDFTDVGDMAVFIDEDQIASLEKRMQERGYLEAHDMATSFNMLRANDLIWSFVVNNYLLGKEQAPFDLLFWNSDSTRMPAAMHSFYLRNMYQRNLLAKPDGISLAGSPIDCLASRRRHSSSQRAKITLRHGNRHMRRRDSMPGPSNSSFRPQVTWPA
jgi:polyhydroxyalkanoate synthase subunit PhaC